MNNEEQNVMTIVTIARIVEASLWYCLPPRNADGFSVVERENRFKALTALTAEGTPFNVNCKQNGETGEKLIEDMSYFIEDVYGKESRIVTVDINNVIHVESSLLVELFTSITRLRAYLEAFITSAMDILRKNNALDKEFEELINMDIRYYHSFAGKVSCVLIANKFLELNDTVKAYADNYSKSHNGINPYQDPEFKPNNDPSFRMIENEFHELNGDMITVLNSYGQNDADFRFAREQVYADCEIFTGKKSTTNMPAFIQMFSTYFDGILNATQAPLNKKFADVSRQMMESAQAIHDAGAKPEAETTEAK